MNHYRVPKFSRRSVLALFIVSPASAATGDHAVIAKFNYGLPSLDALQSADERLEELFKSHDLVEYDGYEIATDLTHGYLYFYGRDADAILEAIRPVLRAIDFMDGAEIVRRYGPATDAQAREVRTRL